MIRNGTEDFHLYYDLDSPITECWDWYGPQSGPKHNRYGVFGCRSLATELGLKARVIKAHRVAFLLQYGYLPSKPREVCHTCDNKLCVNPSHLYEGTHEENMMDCVDRHRIPSGVRHHLAKYTQEFVDRVRAASDTEQYSGKELAALFDIPYTTAYSIAHGLTYPTTKGGEVTTCTEAKHVSNS